MSEEKYVPKSKLARWFDSRLPLLSLSHHLTEYPTPKNLNYWWTFGGILTFFLIAQIVTGIILAMHYVANTDLAFNSIEHIMRNVNYGWLLDMLMPMDPQCFFWLSIFIFLEVYIMDHINLQEK